MWPIDIYIHWQEMILASSKFALTKVSLSLPSTLSYQEKKWNLKIWPSSLNMHLHFILRLAFYAHLVTSYSNLELVLCFNLIDWYVELKGEAVFIWYCGKWSKWNRCWQVGFLNHDHSFFSPQTFFQFLLNELSSHGKGFHLLAGLITLSEIAERVV